MSNLAQGRTPKGISGPGSELSTHNIPELWGLFYPSFHLQSIYLIYHISLHCS